MLEEVNILQHHQTKQSLLSSKTKKCKNDKRKKRKLEYRISRIFGGKEKRKKEKGRERRGNKMRLQPKFPRGSFVSQARKVICQL